MKILKQEKAGNQVTIEVEEAYSKLEPCMEKAYQEASHEVKIPGFRAGKVPSDVLKKYINEGAVIDRAVQFLVSEIYPDVVTESKINPVDYPNVEVKELKKGKPVIFNIKVDVYPQIKLGAYKGLKLTKRETAVTDDETEKTLEFIRSNYAKQNNLKDNEVLLDDDFAKKVSRSGTIAELRVLIKSNIEIEKQEESKAATRDEITKKLSEVVTVDIPKGMIEREIDLMTDDLEVSLKRNRMTLQSYLSAVKKDMLKLRGDLKENALVRVKAKLALEEVAQKEKITVENEDIDAELKVLADSAGKTVEQYKAELSEEVLASMRNYMSREKAIDFVISKAKVE